MSDQEPKSFFMLPEEVEPAWAARRNLAEALRSLSERCVRTDAEMEAMNQAEALVHEAIELLPLGPTAGQAFAEGAFFLNPGIYVDRSGMMGQSNPLAPPLRIYAQGGVTHCEVTLGECFVGAPGMVHGGVLAACFDQVSGFCAAERGYLGFTAQLDIEYKKPAHVHKPLEFTAEAVESTERRVIVEATCTGAGKLLARSRGVFVNIDEDVAAKVFTDS